MNPVKFERMLNPAQRNIYHGLLTKTTVEKAIIGMLGYLMLNAPQTAKRIKAQIEQDAPRDAEVKRKLDLLPTECPKDGALYILAEDVNGEPIGIKCPECGWLLDLDGNPIPF